LRRHGDKAPVLLLELIDADCAIDDETQQVGIDRLAEEIIGAGGHRLHGIFAVLIAGDDDHFRFRCNLEDLLDRGESLGRAIRIGGKTEVDNSDGRTIAFNQVERLHAVAGC